MTFKNFEGKLVLRVLLLCITLSTPAIVILEGWPEALVFLLPLIIYQVYELIHFLKQAQEELNQFVESIHYRDFSRFFTEKHDSAQLEMLRKGFNEINTTFKSINREKETQHQHLQRILELVDRDEAYIINETTVRELGFKTPEQALGQTLMWNTWRDPDLVKTGQVVGVVKDFHYKSLYDKVEPTVLQIYPEAYSKVAVKMETADVANTIVHVKNVWDKFSPDYPIEYNFLDENFDQMYKAEDKLKSLLWIFTGITIFVSCLGLFGLAAYAAERRRKEIGIRKILGASVRAIVLLLSKDFLKMIVIALLIASPVAWYFMHQWLQDFAYRIDIGWWVFGVAGAAVIIVALLTVCFQALKAATANPVNNLRIE